MKILEKKLFSSKAEAVGIVLFLLLAVVPLLFGTIYAILYSTGAIGLMSEGVTLSYWRQTLVNLEFWYSFGFTFYIALVTISLTIISALSITLFLKKPFQKGVPGFSLYVPLAFPAIVVAFFVFQLASQSGFLSRIAWQLGLISNTASFPGWVNDPYGIGIIAAHTFMAMPFFTLYFINIYEQERVKEFSQVAQTLGASRLKQFIRIEIPILIRRAFPTLTLYTIFVLGSYEIPLILGSQSPQMMSVLIIRKLRKFSLSTIPEAYVIALIFISIIILLLILIFKTRTFSYDLDK
jgi:putative spermidine/putrescine transport system permease protein